ncbi:MAG: hypothetical protein AB7I41_03465 [Candidatus Sericytochromatia bacterium]
MFQDKPWLQDFDALPPEKQVEVIDFIQFLKSRKPVENSVRKAQAVTGSFLEQAKDLIGIVDDAPFDLATNPDYMHGFGK